MIALHVFFAGLWGLVWHFGTGFGLAILLFAAGWFTTAIPVIGPFLTGMRKDLWWAAVAVAIATFMMGVGVKLQLNRDHAQSAVVNTTVNNATESVNTPASVAKPDPWDRKDY
jgi:hypothetical protein